MVPPVPIPAYNSWPSPYAYPQIADNAQALEGSDDGTATCNAFHSVIEGHQQAMNGVLTYLRQDRASAERIQHRHNTQFAQVIGHTHSLLMATSDLLSTQYTLEQTVRVLLARAQANGNPDPNPNDANTATPTTDLKQRHLDTLFRDMESHTMTVRRATEGLATVANVKVPNLNVPGQMMTPPMPWPAPGMVPPLVNDFTSTFPWAPQTFPMQMPPSMRPYHAPMPTSTRGPNSDSLPAQTPRSVHWPQGCGTPNPYTTAPPSNSAQSMSPAFSVPTPPWQTMYGTTVSSQTVRPPPSSTAESVSASGDGVPQSPSVSVESFTPAPNYGLFVPRSPPTPDVMPMVPMERRSRRNSKSKAQSNGNIDVYDVGALRRRRSRSRSSSRAPRVPSPHPEFPTMESLMYVPPMPVNPPRAVPFDWEIQNSPLIRPPSGALRESIQHARTPSIELVLPSPPQPAKNVEENRDGRRQSSGSMSLGVFDMSQYVTLSRYPARNSVEPVTPPDADASGSPSPTQSLCTDSSYLAPSEPPTMGSSDAASDVPQPRPAAVVKVESFFEMLRRNFKFPDTVDLNCQGFEVVLNWARVRHASIVDSPPDDDTRSFAFSDTPHNAPVYKYMREMQKLMHDLEVAGLRHNLHGMELYDELLRELQSVNLRMTTMCRTAGALSLADEAISTRDVFANDGHL